MYFDFVGHYERVIVVRARSCAAKVPAPAVRRNRKLALWATVLSPALALVMFP